MILQWTGSIVFIAEANMHMEFKKKTIWRLTTQRDRRIILNVSTGNNYWGCGLD
jgi:hypothetical protein